ncbi:MAG: hypothetical protein WDK95_06780 [Syntrophorhabdaceae bacterium]
MNEEELIIAIKDYFEDYGYIISDDTIIEGLIDYLSERGFKIIDIIK